MRILWLTIDRSNRIAHHFDDFRKSVGELPEVEVCYVIKPAFSGGSCIWRQSKALLSGELPIGNVLSKVLSEGGPFDFIFCDAFFAYAREPWPNTHSAILIEDVHGDVPKLQIEAAESKGIQTIFHRFNFSFHRHHQGARAKFNCFWLPHSIRMERYSDRLSKSIDILHVGVYRIGYPFRRFVVETLSPKPYFKLIERPQDVPDEPRTNKWPIDRDYDNLLQQSRMVVTGGSMYNAPVQKYFEIPAANSLLVSNWFSDLGLLGFIPGINMISCNKENLVNTIEDLLTKPEEIERLSTNGHSLISLKHTSEIRSRQFINSICTILNRPPIYDLAPCSSHVHFDRSKVARISLPSASPIPLGTDWRSRIARSQQC